MAHEMRLKSASVNALGGNRSERHKAGVGLIHHVSSPQTKQRLKCAVLFFRLRFFFLVGFLWYIFFGIAVIFLVGKLKWF